MDAIEALHSRVSSPRLGGDVTTDQLDAIFAAGLRAPDHAQLRPWRFLVIRDEARTRLGEVFVEAMVSDNPDTDDAAKAKTRGKPLRAPVIVIGIASIESHPKVPEVEQVISAGTALQNMSLAAYALGLGAMWRTGSMAFHPVVHRGLGLADNEQIVGFLYLGEVDGDLRQLKPLAVDDYVSEWP